MGILKLTVETHDAKSYEYITKALPTGKVTLFGKEWYIQSASFEAPWNCKLVINNNEIPFEDCFK